MSARGFVPGRSFAAAAVAAVLGLTATVGVMAAVPHVGDIDFKVMRGDSPLGDHRLSFSRQGETLNVEIAVDLGVDFGPFRVYEYTHRNREVWRDGELVRLNSETDDNGESYFVHVERTPEGLRVETRDGVTLASGDVVPTSYWNYDIVEADKVLSTQRGEILEVSTELVGEEEIWVEGEAIPARHYRMTGELELDLWYDADDQWVKTAFVVRGEQIEYFRGGLPEDFEKASFFLRQSVNGASES
jgi:hypothetical protein